MNSHDDKSKRLCSELRYNANHGPYVTKVSADLQHEAAARIEELESARSHELPPCPECDDTKEPRPCGAGNCPFPPSSTVPPRVDTSQHKETCPFTWGGECDCSASIELRKLTNSDDWNQACEWTGDISGMRRRLTWLLEMAERHATELDEARSARSATVTPTEVWELASKTVSMLFATEADAVSYRSTFPASVGGGMEIGKRFVLRRADGSAAK